MKSEELGVARKNPLNLFIRRTSTMIFRRNQRTKLSPVAQILTSASQNRQDRKKGKQGEAMSNGISVPFQIVTLSCTTAILLYLIAGQVYHFCAVDKKPTIHPIEMPSADAKKPAQVKVGLTITDFSEFNVTENKFKITGIVSFIFDPKLISLETIEKFSFLRGDVKYKSKPHVTTCDGLTCAYYSIKATFKTNLYYGFFPFEDHKIFLGLINDEVSPAEMAFQARAEDFKIDTDVYVSGWFYEKHRVRTGYGETVLSAAPMKKSVTYPIALFIMNFFHYSMRYIISIMLPLLIIFFIDMFSLCLDQRQNRSTLVQMSTGNIVALVAYRFVIESISPKVGYPMIADYIFFLFLSISFTMFIINSIGPYLALWQKKAVSIAVQLIVIAAFTYLLEFWIPC